MFQGQLTPAEAAHAEHIGRWRCERAEREKLGFGHGEPSYGRVKHHVIGAKAEKAYALFSGEPWPNDENEFGRGDGDFPGRQIRGTDYWNGHLVIFDEEKKDLMFVLVVVTDDNWWKVVGMIPGPLGSVVGFRPGPDKIRPGSAPQKWVTQSHLEPVPQIWAERKC